MNCRQATGKILPDESLVEEGYALCMLGYKVDYEKRGTEIDCGWNGTA